MLNLNIYSIKLKDSSRAGLCSALLELVSFDEDLSGQNGAEYTSQEALDNGYSSTASYILSSLSNIEDDEELIAKFFKECFKNDSYYQDYNYNIIKAENNSIYALSLATV